MTTTKNGDTLITDRNSKASTTVQWLGPGVGLWEFVIAAHADGAFGSISLHRVAQYIATNFGIKPPNISKIKEDLSLKKNPTAYLDHYRASLISVINSETEKRL